MIQPPDAVQKLANFSVEAANADHLPKNLVSPKEDVMPLVFADHRLLKLIWPNVASEESKDTAMLPVFALLDKHFFFEQFF